MDGGSGTDTVSYMASTAAVNVNLATNTHTGGDAAGDSLLGIESVVGSAYNDTIRGTTANESLNFTAGQELILCMVAPEMMFWLVVQGPMFSGVKPVPTHSSSMWRRLEQSIQSRISNSRNPTRLISRIF